MIPKQSSLEMKQSYVLVRVNIITIKISIALQIFVQLTPHVFGHTSPSTKHTFVSINTLEYDSHVTMARLWMQTRRLIKPNWKIPYLIRQTFWSRDNNCWLIILITIKVTIILFLYCLSCCSYHSYHSNVSTGDAPAVQGQPKDDYNWNDTSSSQSIFNKLSFIGFCQRSQCSCFFLLIYLLLKECYLQQYFSFFLSFHVLLIYMKLHSYCTWDNSLLFLSHRTLLKSIGLPLIKLIISTFSENVKLFGKLFSAIFFITGTNYRLTGISPKLRFSKSYPTARRSQASPAMISCLLAPEWSPTKFIKPRPITRSPSNFIKRTSHVKYFKQSC